MLKLAEKWLNNIQQAVGVIDKNDQSSSVVESKKTDYRLALLAIGALAVSTLLGYIVKPKTIR
jgi:hypothetical protein